MKYGSLCCAKCHLRVTEQDYLCPKCQHDTRFIRLSHNGKPYIFWFDSHGEPLSHRAGLKLIEAINSEKTAHKFDPNKYLLPSIKKMSFEVAYSEWLQEKETEHQAKQFKSETLRAYRSYFKNHFRPLYKLDIREIGLSELTVLLRGLHDVKKGKQSGSGLSLNFKRRLFECLHSFFKWCFRWGKIKAKEHDFPIFPTIEGNDSTPRRVITRTEQIAAIERLPERHRDVFMFMRECALRVNEVMALQVGDLDYSEGRVMIQHGFSGREPGSPKGGDGKTVPMSHVAQSIARRNRFGKIAGAFLFINQDTGRRYTYELLRKVWKKYSGLDLPIHQAFRHSTITEWARKGNAYQVRQLARHGDIRTTLNYVHEVDEDLLKIVEGKE